MAGFATWLSAGDVLEIGDLFVDPERIRQGIGRALVLDLIAIARRRGPSCRGDGEPACAYLWVPETLS